MAKFINQILPIITLFTLPVLLGSFAYLAYEGYQYKQEQEKRYIDLVKKFDAQIQSQEELTASTTAALARSIDIIEKNLALAQSETQVITSDLSSALFEEKGKVATLQQQTAQISGAVGTLEQETAAISGAVGTLEKLSKTDPELLYKYSKVFFLNEYYVPSDLSEIKNQYLYSELKTQHLHSDILPHLTKMLDEALRQNVKLYVKSAYRSFNEQEHLKERYSITYGNGSANKFSADQGYSEHQLGTTVDLITTGLGGMLYGFEKTSVYTWLVNNAYTYGFVLSYPKGNEYYIFEPWHWRFVGKKLAQKLHDENIYFYDMEQRSIDEYLVSIFD